MKLSNHQFVIDLYCKPTDFHQYLHYKSCHQEHLKKSSVYSQGLHIKRLCSDETSLTNHLKDLAVGARLIVTNHPHFNGLNKIMRKNFRDLQANQTIKSLFTPAPFVSFCTALNLRSHLV